MTVKDLYQVLDNRIPASLSCAWDNDGLMCSPNLSAPINRILLTLDVSEAAVDYAVANGCDLIISHHPMIFRPLSAVTEDNFTARKVLKCVQNGISVFSFHTRLDIVEGGVNDRLAELLGLADTEPFGDEETPTIGRIGYVDATTMEAFAELVKARIGVPALQTVELGREVRRVALVGGDGKDFIKPAMRAGADVYLTGTLSYNSMVDAADLGLQVIEAGHFFTEDPVLEALAQMVKVDCPEAEILTYHSDPVTYR
ncbi:MAG: Nif3-like dinuclear metal center hexameric protein [Clostridia bacterium]|nr:Nif3-like dinuclear metal center hexameric protein [Clostridia bacterium]